MPKLKTSRSAHKRFKLTKSGKVKHRQSFRSHMSTHKNAKRMRHLRALKVLKACDARLVLRMFNIKQVR